MVANRDVMGNLHLAVDLDVITNDRIAQCAAVDTRTAADFHVITEDDAAGDLVPACAIMGKPKAITTNHTATVQNHSLAHDHRGKR